MNLAQRMNRIGVESAFEVLAKARSLEAQGRSVIHLEIGEPDFQTPAHIVGEAQDALNDGWTHYGPTQGDPDLREAVASHVHQTRGVRVGPQNISIVPGGKPIMFFVMLAMIEEGDEVVYPDPGFPIYESMIRFLGGVPVAIPLVEERRFSFDLDLLESRLSHRTKMVILNSPHNPTGGIIPAGDIAQLAKLLGERDVMVLSDEIYSRISYDEVPVSIATFPGMMEKTIILDGFSKTYAMTGWRLGFGVMPEWLVEAVTKLMVNSNSCTASFTQRAGIAALNGPQQEVEAMVAEFRRRRDAFVAGLNTLPGFRCLMPGGAFYAFPNIRGTGYSSREIADRLLNETGVAALSGTAFGEHGEGFLRLSYANSIENLMEAVARMRAWLQENPR